MKVQYVLTGSLLALAVAYGFSIARGGGPSTQDSELTLFVSPCGNDAWSGRLREPKKDGTDGPVATVQRALALAREWRAGQENPRARVSVLLREGVYTLNNPILFGPEDSWTILAAESDARALLSGGVRLRGWTETQMNGLRVWRLALPEVREGKWFFRQLFVNGERRPRARRPNEGYFRIDEVLDVTPETRWNEGQNRFRYREGDLEAWDDLQNAEVIVLHRWTESHLPVQSIDASKRVVTFGKRSLHKLIDEKGLPARYWVENVRAALDAPGEWVLDRRTGELLYAPLPNESLDATEVVAPKLEHLIELRGDPAAGRYVEHVTIRSLTLSHTEWWFPPDDRPRGRAMDVGGIAQAAYAVSGAVYAEGARHCVVEDCELSHLGGYGVEFARGCTGNRVVRNRIFDLGAGGVKIGEGVIRENPAERTSGNLVARNWIYSGGRLFPSAVGIWVGQSGDNRILHNDIHDFYYTGISVGWTWGYGTSLARRNKIEWNHIYEIGQGVLSDMGGIYTLGVSPGTTIRYNLIHDVESYGYGGWGIYPDEGSSEILIENNVVYRTKTGGFHQHYGRENVVRNNIFALSSEAQIQRTRAEEHKSFRFEHNIVYWRSGSLLAGRWNDGMFDCDYNLYWKVSAQPFDFAGMSWTQWQALGKDVHSIVADPGFAAPELGDFSVPEDSPARLIGFRPFSVEEVGP